MPSQSYNKFLNLIRDVDELIDAYEVLNNSKPARKNLGFLSRSGILMLCASWEFFMEELLLEAIDFLNSNGISIDDLPKEVKKQISSKVKKEKDEIKPIELAESGWRILWKSYAKIDTELLHTPNQEKLDRLFKSYLGINKISNFWTTYSPKEINLFVKARGKIAHKGRSVKGIQIITLKNYFDMIKMTAIDVDSQMSIVLKNMCKLPTVAWNRTY